MDLKTTYMGLELSSPIVPSASPLSQSVEKVRKMEDCGAGAVVMWSLFEEQIEHEAQELDYYMQYGTERFAESLSYFPQHEDFKTGPDEYLKHIGELKSAVSMPVIASLNGVSSGGWTSYAKKLQQAGADAIELNIYFIPTSPDVTPVQVDEAYVSIVQAVKSAVSIPVAVKIGPFFSSPANLLSRLDDAGADALVLFNRFYQPTLDVDNLAVVPRLTLSRSEDNLLPLRWIAIMFQKVQASLAATTGVITAEDVAKMILAGADVTQMAAALLRQGIDHITEVTKGLERIMDKHGYESVEQMKGVLSQKNCAEPGAFERANYMKALNVFGPTATFE
ncbi:MAG: dihydroorotate dehydrogenase-like protein [Phycisphaerae bacterium]